MVEIVYRSNAEGNKGIGRPQRRLRDELKELLMERGLRERERERERGREWCWLEIEA